MKVMIFNSEKKETIVNVKLYTRDSGGVILHEVNSDGFQIAGCSILSIKPDGIHIFSGYRGSLDTDSDGRVKIHLEE